MSKWQFIRIAEFQPTVNFLLTILGYFWEVNVWLDWTKYLVIGLDCKLIILLRIIGEYVNSIWLHNLITFDRNATCTHNQSIGLVRLWWGDWTYAQFIILHYCSWQLREVGQSGLYLKSQNYTQLLSAINYMQNAKNSSSSSHSWIHK